MGCLQLLQFASLSQAGLAYNAIDREVWRTAQASGMILLTGNRNLKDPDSLEQTIREENTPFSIPVITISDPQEFINLDYRDRCLNRLVEICPPALAFVCGAAHDRGGRCPEAG